MSGSTARPRLTAVPCLRFPFEIEGVAPAGADRARAVRDRIEQVLFTSPGERVFRPEFGAGLKALVFEPNRQALWEITQRRLEASLAKALQGEVDPKSIEVSVSGEGERIDLVVRYQLAAVGMAQQQRFAIGGASG